jgi:hypothetical protein
MSSLTPNYNLIKPAVNSPTDEGLWGSELNSSLDIIDATMKSISDKGFAKINQIVITSSQTYTPSANLVGAYVEAQAAGGGGGGVTSTSGFSAAAGGGTAGSYTAGYFTAAQIGASQTCTIGAAGAGGVGANAGGTGGATSFGALLNVNGGADGGADNGSNTAGMRNNGGAAGTIPTPGTIQIAGQRGTYGFVLGTNLGGTGGTGGTSRFGAGGMQGVNGNGVAGAGYGSGGGGAAFGGGPATQSGGNGTAGVIVITEYLNA